MVHNRCVRTQEVAARAGVNPQRLRYYERIGLLRELAVLVDRCRGEGSPGHGHGGSVPDALDQP